MTKFKLSRKASSVAGGVVLALGPFVAAVACNVYDSSLAAGGSAGLGGTDASAGSDSVGGSVATAGGGVGGTPTSGAASGSAGVSSGGTAGETTNVGGSAGTLTAGSGGSSAAAGAGGDPALEDGDPIDDMEDGNAEIKLSDGRNGYWYVGNDGTANATSDPAPGKFMMFELPMGDRSTYAARLKSMNFTGWGSNIGFNFIEQPGMAKPYDASLYCGVHYWAKAAAAVTVRFSVPDVDTHPDGGVCTNPGAAGTSCFDHFATSVSFSNAWQAFSVKFSQLSQSGTGYHPADKMLKVSKLFSLEWALPGSVAKTYEILIDDVQFTKCK